MGFFKKMTGGLITEPVRVEEDVPLINEEEHILVRIKAQGDKGVTDKREGVVGSCDLDGVVRFDIVGYLSLPVHVTVDSEEFWITCHLVLDQAPERHCKDGVSWLLNC